MGVDDLQFPVLGTFPNGSLEIASSPSALTLNTSTGLKKGYYDGLRLVDSRARWFRVRGARKLHGVGPFGGYTIFLNQRIRVALDLEDEERVADLDELRGIVLADFDAWHGWRSRGDFDLLLSRVQGATSVVGLISVLANMVK